MEMVNSQYTGSERCLWRVALVTILVVLVGLLTCVTGSDQAYADIADGTCGTCSWVIDDDGVLTISPTDGVAGTLVSDTSENGPWYSHRTQIKKVVANPGVTAATGYHLFCRLSQCIEMDLTNLDTSNVTSMYGMFDGCSSLTSLDVSGFNTSNVTSMYYMFSGCSSLTSLDVSGFDTSSVISMSYMFDGCDSLTSLDVSGFDTFNVTSISAMFHGCRSLTALDVSGFDTSKVTSMYSMFEGCKALTSLDVSGFDTSSVMSMSKMFSGCNSLTSLDVSGFNTSNVTNMQSMFSSCSSLASVALGQNFSFKGNNITSTSNMALLPGTHWKKLPDGARITAADLRDTYDGSTMSGTYINDSAFAILYESGGLFFQWGLEEDPSNGTVISKYTGFEMASYIDYRDVPWYSRRNDIINVEFKDVVSPISTAYWFYNCANCTVMDLQNLDTSSVTRMSSMFSNCSKLTSLNLSEFDTSKVTSMYGMFDGCSSLTSLDVSGFDTSKVTTMQQMFYGCVSLTTLDVSGFDTSSVMSMSKMFSGCHSLTSLDVSGFNTSKVTDMQSMFISCRSLTSLDVSGFDTSNVTTMQQMFDNCSVLSSINLGEHFSFKGKNITSTSRQAILPTPPAATTTGKWIREDKTVGPFTSVELRNNYENNAAQWAGTWIWQLKSNTGIIQFNANGGFTYEQQIIFTSTPISVTIPTDTNTSRPGYILTSWNTAADGSGISYTLGQTASIDAPLGQYITLYAQWRLDTRSKYTVQHFQMNTDGETYTLSETETVYGTHFYDDPSDTFTETLEIPYKTYENFDAPTGGIQSVTITNGSTGTIQYYYPRQYYYVAFDGNTADYGYMDTVQLWRGAQELLPASNYQKGGSYQTGWNAQANGSGDSYANGQPVLNIAPPYETVTLYAQWMTIENVEGADSGEILVSAKAGQKVIIPNLPAGTTYKIEEVSIPSGWRQTNSDSATGRITAGNKSESSATNTYESSGSASIVAHKRLNGSSLEAGMFTFELRDSRNNLIATATNGSIDNEQWTFDEASSSEVANP